MNRLLRAGALWLLIIGSLWPVLASAHAARENYVWVNVEPDHLSGYFEVHVRDLVDKLGVKIDEAGATRLEGARNAREPVQRYLDAQFAIVDQNGKIPIRFLEPSLLDKSNDYIQYPFRTDRLPTSMTVRIDNGIFLSPGMMSSDRLHRSLLLMEHNRISGAQYPPERTALVFTPTRLSQSLDLNDPPGILASRDFLWQGVVHIWGGLDHVLFLVVLLLTSVLKFDEGAWQPVARLRSAFVNIVIIVSVFTLAHSITFSLTALEYIQVDPVLIESIIAASIIAVALNNIFPRYSAHTWALVFVFGLFHGVGFASAMSDLQYRSVEIKSILLRFNLGVELGQLAIVALIFPVLYLLRRRHFYERWVVMPASSAAALIAGLWVLQRIGLIAG